MSITTDPTTDVGKVRMLTGDKYEEALFFEDNEVQAFLDMYDDVRMAAAAALDSMASMSIQIFKVVNHLDLNINSSQMASALREHAAELRREVEEEPAFAVAEQVHDAFSHREFVWNDMQGRGG